MHQAQATPRTTLFICATCGMVKDPATGQKPTNPESEKLATQTAALLAGTAISVQLTKCLSMCNQPIAWALSGPGRHATSFSPATCAEDLATTAHLYLSTPLGEKMPKKELPKDTKPTLISRIPPLDM